MAVTWKKLAYSSDIGSSVASNLVASPMTIATDASYVIVSYLNVTSDLTISGNLMVTG